MVLRCGLLLALSALSFAGCCCPGGFAGNGCGPCGGEGLGPLFCRPYEQRMAAGELDDCGTCVTPAGCGNGGIKGWLRNNATCCKGCGDIYWGEWTSDPPDCCDPCDQGGDFTGCGGTACRVSCLDRLARIFSGYRYCPDECGGNCGLGGLGCRLCGGAGCDDCSTGLGIRGRMVPSSVLDENWDPPPAPKPAPGKPIHKADTPHSVKVGAGRMPGAASARQASYEPWR